MSIDDNLRDMFNEAIPPADTPTGLADELIAQAGATGSTAAGASTGLGLPLIIGLAVAGGIVVGGVLGFLGGGGTPSAGATVDIDAVPAYACPGEGEVGTLFRGDRVLITGRSGEWVAVRNVRGANERVFVRSDDVSPDADISGLPEENCDDSGTLASADATSDTTTTLAAETTTTSSTTTTTTSEVTTTSAVTTTTTAPTTTTTTSAATTTTTAPTTTTSSTTTTQAPDTTDPVIGNKSITPGVIWELDGLGISCVASTPRQATISAFVTDNVGVTSVTATWSDPLGNQSLPMSPSGSTYTATFGPYAAGTWGPIASPYQHPVTVTITARDAAGNTTATTVSVTVTEIAACFG